MCQKVDRPSCCKVCDYHTVDISKLLGYSEICDKTGRQIINPNIVLDGCPLKGEDMKTIKDYIDRYDVGSCLHTALRKVGDGPWSNVVYHALYLYIGLENDLWTEYCGRIWDEIKDRSFENTNENYKVFGEIVRNITIDDDTIDKQGRPFGFFQNISRHTYKSDVRGEAIARILHEAFENFKGNDWQSYVSLFCEEWHTR